MIMLNLTQYERWKAEVDRVLVEICGEDSEGIPDFDYYEGYRLQVEPELVAADAFLAGCALYSILPTEEECIKLKQIAERYSNRRR